MNKKVTPPNYLCHHNHNTDILFELSYKNVAHKFEWVHHSKYGEVLKPIYTNKPKPFGELNLSEMYREFLGILQPFSDFGLAPSKWIETLDANSDYMKSLSEDEYLEFKATVSDMIKLKIKKHAENYGFGSNKLIGNMLPQTLKGLLTIPQSFRTEDNNPRHIASYKSIVQHAIYMYDCLTLSAEELMEDEAVCDFVNQNEARVTLGYETKGMGILVSGYWSCLWWGFLLDEQRMKATKCLNCGVPIIRTKSARFSSDKCRANFNNTRYKLKKLIEDTKAMPNTKERTKAIKDLQKTLDVMNKAVKK
jgi:hypothetical protein